MADFLQHGPITTLHDLNTVDGAVLERLLNEAAQTYHIGLVLPITASDMRAEPFSRIVDASSRHRLTPDRVSVSDLISVDSSLHIRSFLGNMNNDFTKIRDLLCRWAARRIQFLDRSCCREDESQACCCYRPGKRHRVESHIGDSYFGEPPIPPSRHRR